MIVILKCVKYWEKCLPTKHYQPAYPEFTIFTTQISQTSINIKQMDALLWNLNGKCFLIMTSKICLDFFRWVQQLMWSIFVCFWGHFLQTLSMTVLALLINLWHPKGSIVGKSHLGIIKCQAPSVGAKILLAIGQQIL